MHTLAHGIDLVPVARLARSIDQHGDRFLERVFTSGERDYAHANKRRDEHLAARFAAKEAVFKALGTGWSGGIAWTDVEVTRDESGRPAIVLTGKAATIAASLGIKSWLVSLSHTEDHAIASVIGLG
ncbi:MAG: holo-ACP synthase [Phycisphaerales bacterium]|nr:MAG: holo-ACP synthase [Phycisphaerales bacterium]